MREPEEIADVGDLGVDQVFDDILVVDIQHDQGFESGSVEVGNVTLDETNNISNLIKVNKIVLGKKRKIKDDSSSLAGYIHDGLCLKRH